MVSKMDNAPVVEFVTYKQYANLIMDIFEGVNENFDYALAYKQHKKKKDFSTFEITEVFPLD